jgi:hypothetical protein
VVFCVLLFGQWKKIFILFKKEEGENMQQLFTYGLKWFRLSLVIE